MKTFVRFLILSSICFFQSCAQDRALRLVILPDTQSYLESCPEIMEAQFNWLADQEADVDYVLHVGDITQDNTHAEWALAATYFDLIHDRIPYAISLGNHDFGSAPGKYADVRDSQLANKYFPINNRFHFVTGVSASTFLSSSQPYTMVRGIGYNPDFIRGFEVNVIEGHQTLVHKNSFRFELFNIYYDISAIMPLEEFSTFPVRAYLSANFDHGYVIDKNKLPQNNALTNAYLYGYGLGLDLFTFYDQVFRFEYSINSQGKGNFFINVRAPL